MSNQHRPEEQDGDSDPNYRRAAFIFIIALVLIVWAGIIWLALVMVGG